MDSFSIEFCNFRSAPDCQLPSFNASDGSAIDSFWAAMANIHSLTNLESFRFGGLSKLAQTLLVLTHSNADYERLFSMVRKIETEERTRSDPSTVSDLLSVKLNNEEPCYMSQHL